MLPSSVALRRDSGLGTGDSAVPPANAPGDAPAMGLAYPSRISLNPSVLLGTGYPDACAAVLDSRGYAGARCIIAAWPGYQATPLRDLTGLARRLGIGSLHYKDESARFGLGSYKPLGGVYAIFRLLKREIKAATGVEQMTVTDLLEGRFSDVVAGITVAGAADGNLGRSMAWGARMFGCRCVVFIDETVSRGRERAIASYGAEVRRTPGTFGDAVCTAQAVAETEGWHVISDTSDGTEGEAPLDVIRGYSVMAGETIAQLPYEVAPTHIFLQAGVGDMAAAVCAAFWWTFGVDRPVTLLVEPTNAACWRESLLAGEPSSAGGNLESIMADLARGQVSQLAWKILQPGAFAAMTVAEEAAVAAMRLLAKGAGENLPIVAGESGVAGLAGLIVAAEDDEIRASLGLDKRSRVVVFGTEGATDADTYRRIVGCPAEDVAGGS